MSDQQRLGIGGHHSPTPEKDEWLTPPHVLQALGAPEAFDLDPCAPAARPWPMARAHFTAEDNGLIRPWRGRVFLNPPYGAPKILGPWLRRMAAHGCGIMLIFARTETELFFEHVWRRADALLFIEGRLHFHHVDGSRAQANSGAPSVLVAYGISEAALLERCGIAGAFVRLRASEEIL